MCAKTSNLRLVTPLQWPIPSWITIMLSRKEYYHACTGSWPASTNTRLLIILPSSIAILEVTQLGAGMCFQHHSQTDAFSSSFYHLTLCCQAYRFAELGRYCEWRRVDVWCMGVPVCGISGIQQDRVDVWWMGVLVCGISGIQQDVEWMFGGWGYWYVASVAYSRT